MIKILILLVIILITLFGLKEGCSNLSDRADKRNTIERNELSKNHCRGQVIKTGFSRGLNAMLIYCKDGSVEWQ